MTHLLENNNPIFEDKNKNELEEDENMFYEQPQFSEKAALLEDDDYRDNERRKEEKEEEKISW